MRSASLWLVWIVAWLLVGCSPQRALTEWVARRPEPVRLGCPAAIARTEPSAPSVPIVLHAVGSGPGLSGFAGDLDQPPNSLRVPYSDDAPPLAVFEADLRRILGAHTQTMPAEAAPAVPAARPFQLNATLQVAYTDRTFYFLKSSEMRGRVVFDFTIVDPDDGHTAWEQRISEEYLSRPAYITSRSVEEALNGAYCEALTAFGKALSSSGLLAALRR